MRNDKELLLQIGKNIKEARETAELTQAQLADLVDITPQYVSQIERGINGPSLAVLVLICKILCVPADFILSGRRNKDVPASSLDAEQRISLLSPSQQAFLNNHINSAINLILASEKPSDRK